MKEIKVLISQTLSREVTIDVPDYYSEKDIRHTVDATIVLPSDDMGDWSLDEYTVMEIEE